MALTLYIDVVNKTLLKTANGPVITELPPFYYSATMDLLIYPRQKNPVTDRDNPYIAFDWTDYTCSAELGVADADSDTVPAAVTTTFSDIDAGKSGSFNLNTLGVAELLGEKESVQAFFEIKATPTGGSADVVLQLQVELRGVVLDGEALPPSVRPDYITRDEALALFAKKIGLPGETIEFTSPNGTKWRVIGVRNDESHQDDSGSN